MRIDVGVWVGPRNVKSNPGGGQRKAFAWTYSIDDHERPSISVLNHANGMARKANTNLLDSLLHVGFHLGVVVDVVRGEDRMHCHGDRLAVIDRAG